MGRRVRERRIGFLVSLLVVASLVLVGVWVANLGVGETRGQEVLSESALVSISAPTPSPAVSPSPEPQEEVPPGYCLLVPVLLYHHIEPMEIATAKNHAQLTVDAGNFEKQVAFLVSAGYTTISADQLAQALINHQKLPAKSILITLDDGYQDAYTYAFSIIKKYNIVVNLFVATGLLENPDYLTWGQLKEMVESGLVFAYDHTWSHSHLTSLSSERAEFEILTAKSQLEERLGKAVNILAYPYGSYDGRVQNLIREKGFVAAFSTNSGFWQCDWEIMSLRRTRIGNSALASYGL